MFGTLIDGTVLNISVAILLLRMVAGILFFFQAYDKIFNIGIKNVVNTFSGNPYGKKVLPDFMLTPLVYVSSYVELIGGVLLLLGLFRNYALYLLSADLIFVAFAFSVIKPMWDMQFYSPRLLLIFFLLMIPPSFDVIALDKLMH